MDALAECLDLPNLEDALSSLPDTLDETYSRILDNVPKRHRPHAIRILQFLAFAERPLRLEEAVDAIAVRPSLQPPFEKRNRMPIPQEIGRFCSSLVIIMTRQVNFEDDYTGNKTTDGIVTEIRLAHFSVKEYLVSDRLAESFGDFFKQSRAESDIVQISLAYLFAAARDSDVDDVQSSLPFAKFSARYWMKHAVMAEQDKKIVEVWTIQIFTEPKVHSFWLRLFDPDRPWDNKAGSPTSPGAPLYYASLGGLGKSVKLLVDKGADVNAQGGFYGTALQAASGGGYEEIVQLLVDKGADVNAQGGEYGNALQVASEGGHKQIVRLLVDKGADVNAQGGLYGTALYVASEGGHKQIVRLLVDKGADVNAQGGFYGTALQAASGGGYEEIVQLLVDKGADVNAQGGEYGNALQVASEGGHKQIVRLLVDKGADVNAQGGLYGTALYVASEGGHKQIVRLLVDKGADVNAQGGFYGTALQAASGGGYEEIVQLLVDKGADVNAQGGLYGTALHAASERRYEEIVRLLVDKGAKLSIDSLGR